MSLDLSSWSPQQSSLSSFSRTRGDPSSSPAPALSSQWPMTRLVIRVLLLCLPLYNCGHVESDDSDIGGSDDTGQTPRSMSLTSWTMPRLHNCDQCDINWAAVWSLESGCGFPSLDGLSLNVNGGEISLTTERNDFWN